jgi:iron complex outermembrane receptor protein
MDGRSLYTPLFGGTFWDMQSTLIEDIDRIEVIRGPGATLWGGNAVNCVINIITRTAADTQGVLAVAGGGTTERGFGALRFGGDIGGRAHYRVYGNAFKRRELVLQNGQDAGDPFHMEQGGFRADADLTPSDRVTLQGDIYTAQMGQPAGGIGLHGVNLIARWTHRLRGGSEFQVQAYIDRTSRLVPAQADEVRHTYDVDLQHRIRLGDRHDFVWGAGYRASNDRTRQTPRILFNPTGRHIALFNLFAQDEIALAPDRFYLILGSKFEKNTYTGWQVMPSARLLWTPDSRHSVWTSVARAMRIPTRFDRDLVLLNPANGAVQVLGSRDFRSEELTAYEAGYRFLPDPRLYLDIAAYYNRYRDLRSQEPSATIFPLVLGNKMRARTMGVELTARYQLLSWWRLTAGYSNLQRSLWFDPDSRDPTGGLLEGADPRNQFSFRSYMDLPRRTELDFWVRHVSALQVFGGPPVPPYTVFDARLGWRPTGNLELSLVGRNLPGKHHLEFGPAGELIRRGVYLTTTWRF